MVYSTFQGQHFSIVKTIGKLAQFKQIQTQGKNVWRRAVWWVGWPKSRNLIFSRNIYYKFWRSEIERSLAETNLKETLLLEVYSSLQSL